MVASDTSSAGTKIKDPSNARFYTSSLTPYHHKDIWLVCGGVLDMLWCHGERSASIVKNQLFSRLPSGSREKNISLVIFSTFVIH